ncbi:metalloregulator ArsR/SmtB family transcription factor [Aminobacter sp. MDW-2]|jgi:ArsR family transcriptional regulator|uniref:ArsR/SmtB family transcription factor n=1 Tax=Aminobacter sp. MDW-2 TaxID=2666139 RepID=UPI0012B0A1BF|nr:metalloregulator ArsR/SmtB family transcription factor [Aminobacter sp. MDW-2]MRX35120.1 metalloregulator ArsR/SmtB family transcription factor [Aminobacter sp. MDW-2]QNH36063.1 helix-turn-helix transcriptional regulator [Aminobacter sp. MDW-2]WMC96207.1 metalloregulator ArsR/SmtB family transcription factor [Aminobacter aminovorans]
MDANDTIDALAALAQPTRLEAFRQMAAAEPDGIAAGDLARRLDVPQNTMSAHLAVLTRAGLATGDRQGRSIIYRANLPALRNVLLFLLQDCCDGKPEICAPLLAELSPCCTPSE